MKKVGRKANPLLEKNARLSPNRDDLFSRPFLKVQASLFTAA
jgi:hypothetical protein